MLQVQHLTKSYKTGTQLYPVLKDISFEVKKGEFVAVMGPSGSGKTTLLNCISCFIPHDEGKILLGDQDISGLKEDELARVRNEKLGFVFQDFMLLDGLTVFENICLPQIIAEKPAAQMEAKAGNFCHIFGIDKIMDKYPAMISGGEKQQAKKELEATVFMVTHDTFAASFCDRVIVLKDGCIYRELTRSQTRREFMDVLLDTIRELGEDDDNE